MHGSGQRGELGNSPGPWWLSLDPSYLVQWNFKYAGQDAASQDPHVTGGCSVSHLLGDKVCSGKNLALRAGGQEGHVGSTTSCKPLNP